MTANDPDRIIVRDKLGPGTDAIRSAGWHYTILVLPYTAVPAALSAGRFYRAEVALCRGSDIARFEGEVMVEAWHIFPAGTHDSLCVAFAEDILIADYLGDAEIELRIDPIPKAESDRFETLLTGSNGRIRDKRR